MTRRRSIAFDELTYVRWLERQARRSRAVRIGPGDDMACLATSASSILVASDMLLDGVHFDSAVHGLRLIGRKAMACNLSDCAAMAVRPVAATVSLALPRRMGLADAKELYRGLDSLAGEFGVSIVGGDTTRWDHPLAIDVAIWAVPFAGIPPVRRSGGRTGDRLYVTGLLGGSILGRHLRFTPRVGEARRLATTLGARLHAMMDISDGLLLDLHRLCQASSLGACLDEGELRRVVSPAARRLARRTGRSPLEHACGDGEDFELLVAVAGEVSDVPVQLYPIGRLTRRGLTLRTLSGRVQRLKPRGYVHA